MNACVVSVVNRQPKKERKKKLRWPNTPEPSFQLLHKRFGMRQSQSAENTDIMFENRLLEFFDDFSHFVRVLLNRDAIRPYYFHTEATKAIDRFETIKLFFVRPSARIAISIYQPRSSSGQNRRQNYEIKWRIFSVRPEQKNTMKKKPKPIRAKAFNLLPAATSMWRYARLALVCLCVWMANFRCAPITILPSPSGCRPFRAIRTKLNIFNDSKWDV